MNDDATLVAQAILEDTRPTSRPVKELAKAFIEQNTEIKVLRSCDEETSMGNGPCGACIQCYKKDSEISKNLLSKVLSSNIAILYRRKVWDPLKKKILEHIA